MWKLKNYTLIFFILLTMVLMASVEEYAVQVSAQVQESPPQITFSWPDDPAANQYYVFKKSKMDTSWGEPIAVLNGSATQFIDENIDVGEAFEYGFYKYLPEINHSVVVANGSSLNFKIYDSWGDGISPHHGLGTYQVFGNEELYVSGGIFGGQEFTSFIVDGGEGTTGDNITVSIELDVFGDETTWDLINNSSGYILGSGGPYSAPKFSHIFAGIKYPFAENRGTVILIVDDAFTIPLSVEITRLQKDLICDGWKVKRLDVPRFGEVTDVKEMIVNECAVDPSINTIFLLGHIPVPYSGNVMSAHTNHQGAHPADVYYGELDDEWTDVTVNNTSASRPENHNIPGDGKFDQTFIVSGVDLQVGRVDLYNMPVFTIGSVELTRRYLNKNHDYRVGINTASRRGLIDDNVGDLGGMAIAANGLRNFSAMFGYQNVFNRDYFSTMDENSYLWSQGCGGGGYTGCSGVGTTTTFASNTVQSVFTMLYGSYFGDWDNENNFLKAPLASEGMLLCSMWAGAPAWHFHHMALGETIGYSTRLSQNNINLYTPSDKARQIHTALMGDPTLRLHVVKSPSSFQIDSTGLSPQLQWEESPDEVEGYHIFRANSLYSDFTRITETAITDTQYVDLNPLEGNNVYMVRALKLETTGSGTYYNLSQGILDSVFVASTVIDDEFENNDLKFSLKQNYPNPFNPSTVISYQLPVSSEVELTIYNALGQKVQTLLSQKQAAGTYSIEWNAENSPGGVYYYQLKAGNYAEQRKMLLIK